MVRDLGGEPGDTDDLVPLDDRFTPDPDPPTVRLVFVDATLEIDGIAAGECSHGLLDALAVVWVDAVDEVGRVVVQSLERASPDIGVRGVDELQFGPVGVEDGEDLVGVFGEFTQSPLGTFRAVPFDGVQYAVREEVELSGARTLLEVIGRPRRSIRRRPSRGPVRQRR